MNKNMDELLKAALAPTDGPQERLNQQVLLEIEEREDMKSIKCMKHKKRFPAAVFAAACILALGSITAVAAHRYLSPGEVATEVNDDALKNAFLGEDAVLVNETQESGGYRITLIGSVAGRNISDYLETDGDGAVQEDKIYTIVAIERADGTPMPDTSSDEYGKECFYTSHYIRGLNPKEYSIMSMGGGYTEFIKDGVMYRLLCMDNIGMFADRGIYVGVSTGTFYDSDAYRYDESTGSISRNERYDGVNALFELPVDKSKADPAAAAAYLEALQASWAAPDTPPEQDAADIEVEAFMEQLTAEKLDSYADPIESTRMSCGTPDEDGAVLYRYELEDGSAGNGAFWVTPEMAVGEYQIAGYTYSENGLEDLLIDVFIINEDKTVTFVVYRPIGQ